MLHNLDDVDPERLTLPCYAIAVALLNLPLLLILMKLINLLPTKKKKKGIYKISKSNYRCCILAKRSVK